ncbi:hypothetical protein SORBI_3004G091900 [Sorghum bicolor]|uniref:Uncharacterized protein n=1 Tax=Sorghum bicolor TaxID=4558 RepID=A0A194YNN4_SORBI|nr:hypothetical protein SORBI_3004G091900 [Sorghum bicolor]
MLSKGSDENRMGTGLIRRQLGLQLCCRRTDQSHECRRSRTRRNPPRTRELRPRHAGRGPSSSLRKLLTSSVRAAASSRSWPGRRGYA